MAVRQERDKLSSADKLEPLNMGIMLEGYHVDYAKGCAPTYHVHKTKCWYMYVLVTILVFVVAKIGCCHTL
jgi:hypothetical protein